MITGKTKVYGLIGNPVAQSFSPFIHNSIAKEMGIDMTYVTFPVMMGSLSDAYTGMKALGIQGMNVTVPYKSDIIEKLDIVDPEAGNIGAVNTLVPTDKGVVGYNTDWIGLLRSLKRNRVDLTDKNILVIGAGGAARAVAVMCAKEKARRIIIANRTLSKAQEIKLVVEERYGISSGVLSIEAAQETRGFDIVFQTTSVGMYPKMDVSPVSSNVFFQDVTVAIDLIYNPAETRFLESARKTGCQTINGLEMLFFQAVKAFELWRDLTVPENIQDRCLEAFRIAVSEKS